MGLPKNNIVDNEGRIILYGIEEFVNDIGKSNHCFICGAPKGSKEFNDEHIIPNWLLRKLSIHNREVKLPNGESVIYGNYKISCCQSCNEELGKIYEKPISSIFDLGYSEIEDLCKKDSEIRKKIFRWLILIFLKTHLKDNNLRYHLDIRKGTESIGDFYHWENLHHLHVMARSHYTNALIEENVYGTLLIFPVHSVDEDENFDFGDLVYANTIFIRINDICFVAILNDSKMVLEVYHRELEKITGALNSFQIREVYADVSYINAHIKYRPEFMSFFDEEFNHKILAIPPLKLELAEKNSIVNLSLLKYELNRSKIIELIGHELDDEYLSENNISFLFDENGQFVENEM